jgi:hypothetical protein
MFFAPVIAVGFKNAPTQYESVTLRYFSVGAFYFPPCGAYRLLRSGTFTITCPSTTSPTATETTTISARTLTGGNWLANGTQTSSK